MTNSANAGDRRHAHGVVTLADANYFPGLLLLHRSIRESWPVPVVCFDGGLTEAQRRHAAETCPDLQILALPETALLQRIRVAFETAAPLAKLIKRVWPLWICPLLIDAAPFRRVFWMDCDVVVLRHLDRLFALLDEGPVFTPENLAPLATPNRPELYALMPIRRPFDLLEPTVNGGVSGWDLDRDRVILDAYVAPIARACDDADIRRAISWHDQGALIWAIQQTGLQHRVMPTTAWNLCVVNTTLASDPVAWSDAFLAEVRTRVPQVNLLHWNGQPPPWPLPALAPL
jgi:hypothetical protein